VARRDRFGWNGTQYYPSKPSQEAFAKVVHEFFQHHSEVFHFANATIDVKAFSFFQLRITKQVSRIQPMWTIFVSFSLIASMVFYIMLMAK
jgi:hypothetical protein